MEGLFRSNDFLTPRITVRRSPTLPSSLPHYLTAREGRERTSSLRSPQLSSLVLEVSLSRSLTCTRSRTLSTRSRLKERERENEPRL
jgi:hypothetical protein